jgi:hypothetical protein
MFTDVLKKCSTCIVTDEELSQSSSKRHVSACMAHSSALKLVAVHSVETMGEYTSRNIPGDSTPQRERSYVTSCTGYLAVSNGRQFSPPSNNTQVRISRIRLPNNPPVSDSTPTFSAHATFVEFLSCVFISSDLFSSSYSD